ncbi:MAG: hypothetical protein EBS01_08105 [Verrucomicrobia bacterium]|nr:hypothetical protein [Verrucomicrobiota bacterium]
MKNVPDTWVLVEYEQHGKKATKVLSRSACPLSLCNQWKLSSGVVKIEEFEDRYEFTNRSGSLYVCYKTRHGLPDYMPDIYRSLAEKCGTGFTISLSPNVTLNKDCHSLLARLDSRAISRSAFAQLGKMKFQNSSNF